MEQKWGFSLRGPVTNKSKKCKVKRKNFCLLPFALCLFLFAGCGSKQMARIDENQFKLETMVEANARQIAEIATRLNQNQQELYVVIENVQNDVAKVAVDVAAVADAQMKLHAAVQSGSRQVTGEMASLEQSQNDMTTSLGQAIAGVQSETRQVAVDVTTVTAEQTKLYEIVQENNVQLNNKVAVIEQAQQERQDTIGGMQDNVRAVAASISALGEDMLRLQEILQNNIRELVSIADITNSKQVEFQQSLKTDIQTLDESLTSLKTSQNALQSRIQEMQNDAPDFSNMPAALDQLRDQLEELSRSSEVDEVDSIEYETSQETNSIE
jgi:hypothetical protein